ncbi:hypothetical protein OPV22_002724 [Ensete ventricosum]|uniref:Uncharacterized protein n=1 Tax=Ensete ventricosum TaxID=4639 RepID=A0AAV8RYW3_ENSVE|nr:hypothetical protein OPV22_002724 [Ensete ventricosum]
MIRSLKKLKIWSRLKKRRRPATPIQQGPHSGHRCSCSARQATPPLLLSPPLDLTFILTSAAHSGAPASYQQYLAPSPVFGVPTPPGVVREGVFCGCFTGIAALAALLRYCLCCFQHWPC